MKRFAGRAEAVMTEQAVVEAARADERDGRDRAGDDTPVSDEALVADDLLVEEVSIDGMCGVY
jgi:mycofactocin precursor